jgi:hypothetical protein
MPTHTKFQIATDLNRDVMSQTLEENIVDFLRWGFLEIGGFTSVPVLSPGTALAKSPELFEPVSKGSVIDYKTWQAPHRDWVYETGLDYSPAPTLVTGVYVNGTHYPTATTTGAFAHKFDLVHGRVIFQNAISASSVVQAAYSYRWVSVFDQDVPWFRSVVLDAYLTEDEEGGVIKVLDDSGVELPAVVVESVMAGQYRGREIGSNTLTARKDMLFHVLADNKSDRDRIADVISLQQGITIWLYDVNARRTAGDYPLKWDGSPNLTARMYPSLISQYPFRKAYFERTRGDDATARFGLYRGTVRASIECDFGRV